MSPQVAATWPRHRKLIERERHRRRPAARQENPDGRTARLVSSSAPIHRVLPKVLMIDKREDFVTASKLWFGSDVRRWMEVIMPAKIPKQQRGFSNPQSRSNLKPRAAKSR